MTNTVGPTAADVAKRATELKIVFLALQLSIPSLYDPTLPLLQADLRRLDTPPTGDIPVFVRNEEDGAALTYSSREIYTYMASLQGDVLAHDILSIGMMHAASRLGDMIQEGGLGSRAVPLLQFARHFRNACAHGDRWHFKGKEPEFHAECRGLILNVGMHGQRATMETVGPKLFIEFLDDIANYFVPGTVDEPTEGLIPDWTSR